MQLLCNCSLDNISFSVKLAAELSSYPQLSFKFSQLYFSFHQAVNGMHACTKLTCHCCAELQSLTSTQQKDQKSLRKGSLIKNYIRLKYSQHKYAVWIHTNGPTSHNSFKTKTVSKPSWVRKVVVTPFLQLSRIPKLYSVGNISALQKISTTTDVQRKAVIMSSSN